MPFGGLLTGGAILAGGVASYFGATQQANAAKDIGEKQLEQQNKDRQQALGYATPTLQELQALSQQLTTMQRTYTLQDAALTRDTTLLSAIDPALISAGQQAYAMLNGQESPALAPMRTQIANQRKALVQSLEQQYGSGYASSSAGISALNQFDQNASAQLSQTQLGEMNTLLGISSQNRPNMLNEVNQSGATMSQMGGQYLNSLNNIQGRQISAITGTPIKDPGAASYGNLVSGQNLAGYGNQLTGLGTYTLGQMAGKSSINIGGYGSTMNTGGTGQFNLPEGSTVPQSYNSQYFGQIS